MSYEITVEGIPELSVTVGDLTGAIENPSEGLIMAVYEVFYTQVLSKSMSTWNVRTGLYSASWYYLALSSNVVELGNSAPYAMPLETGWTTKAGNLVPSPGVLYPTIEEGADRLVDVLNQWIASKANL